MMIDIDDFKFYNDHFGHAVGDQILSVFGSLIIETFKGGNAYRYGGDEFIIIAELNHEEEAERLCSDVRQALIAECVRDGIVYDLSFSFGYVKYDKSYKNMQAFIAAADEKLYEAKLRREKKLLPA